MKSSKWNLIRDLILHHKVPLEQQQFKYSNISITVYSYKINKNIITCVVSGYGTLQFIAQEEITLDEVNECLGNPIDNTGNVKLWEPEIYIADYLIQNKQQYSVPTTIEIGSGYHGLAAQCMAMINKDGKYTLTDGNDKCVNCNFLRSTP